VSQWLHWELKLALKEFSVILESVVAVRVAISCPVDSLDERWPPITLTIYEERLRVPDVRKCVRAQTCASDARHCVAGFVGGGDE
jgi:hypothetical protein